MKKATFIFRSVLVLTAGIMLSGCFGRGEDDPFFSLHTRDARLAQNWKMAEMQGTVINTTDGLTTTTRYEFDGSNIFITTDGSTVSYGYTYNMNIKDNGDIQTTETFTDPANANQEVLTSTKTSFWFWSNDDKNKTTVNLDATGILADYQSYDIPRLAWSDMTLVVNFSDNYQQNADSVIISSSNTVDFQIKFEYDNGRN